MPRFSAAPAHWSLPLLACFLLTSVTPACQIPVFRYALERWEPDKYVATVIHDRPLNGAEQSWVDRLTESASSSDRPLNLEVRTLSWEQIPDPAPWLMELPRPALVVHYPGSVSASAPAWSGPLTTTHVENLLDSPVRREIAARLLRGESAVWVVLTSGDANRDQQVLETMERELTRAQQELKLPDLSDIKNDEFYRPETQVELKLQFSLLPIPPDAPEEEIFRSLLRHSEPGLADLDPPIAIPVYGRGRTYFALVGAGITGSNIDDSCRFLVGACSCQVKAQNPGIDLPFAVAWSREVTGSALPTMILPELTGLGGLTELASPPASDKPAIVEPVDPVPASAPAASVPLEPVPAVSVGDESVSDVTTRLFYAMLALMGGMMAIIGVASFWFRPRTPV